MLSDLGILGPLPQAIPCPHCHAPALVPCGTPTGYGATTHRGRWRAVGVDDPDDEDRRRDLLCAWLLTLAGLWHQMDGHRPASSSDADRTAFVRASIAALRKHLGLIGRDGIEPDATDKRRLAARLIREFLEVNADDNTVVP